MKIISEGHEINLPSVNVNDGIYDDQERLVGTWFGKPLYRITVKTVSPDTLSRDLSIYDAALLNIDSLITLDGMLESTASNDAFAPIIFNGPNTYTMCAFYKRSTKRVMMRIDNAAYMSCNISLTLKYTKTTDPGESRILTSEPFSDSLDAVGSSVAASAI